MAVTGQWFAGGPATGGRDDETPSTELSAAADAAADHTHPAVTAVGTTAVTSRGATPDGTLTDAGGANSVHARFQ